MTFMEVDVSRNRNKDGDNEICDQTGLFVITYHFHPNISHIIFILTSGVTETCLFCHIIFIRYTIQPPLVKQEFFIFYFDKFLLQIDFIFINKISRFYLFISCVIKIIICI